MDIDLSSYSIFNWINLQPAIHFWKTSRYRRVDRKYRKLPARVSKLDVPSNDRSNMIIAIAFEDAELIDWQSRLMRRFVPTADYIVVDNSKSIEGANAIKAICEKRRCNYLLAPENPWHGSPSRSHGLALNWALDNVVNVRKPQAFGFIDADIFPTEPTDPFAPLRQQDFFGVVRHMGERWYLWAGFCFFRYSLVERFRLNFGQAWFLGLDTGGANWNILYKHYALSTLMQMETSFFPFKQGLNLSDGPLQRCGSWIHEVGQMGLPEYAFEKRDALGRMLESNLKAID